MIRNTSLLFAPLSEAEKAYYTSIEQECAICERPLIKTDESLFGMIRHALYSINPFAIDLTPMGHDNALALRHRGEQRKIHCVHKGCQDQQVEKNTCSVCERVLQRREASQRSVLRDIARGFHYFVPRGINLYAFYLAIEESARLAIRIATIAGLSPQDVVITGIYGAVAGVVVGIGAATLSNLVTELGRSNRLVREAMEISLRDHEQITLVVFHILLPGAILIKTIALSNMAGNFIGQANIQDAAPELVANAVEIGNNAVNMAFFWLKLFGAGVIVPFAAQILLNRTPIRVHEPF